MCSLYSTGIVCGVMANKLVALSPARKQDASITPPLAYGAHKSKLMATLADADHSEKVTLIGDDRLRLVMWIDANAPYHDRFVNKRPKTVAYDLASDEDLRQELHGVHDRRCASCHGANEITRLDWIDIHHVARSRFLTAPLARSVGGEQKCSQTTYADADDPDYVLARNLVSAAVSKAWEKPRRDLRYRVSPSRGLEGNRSE